jgi:hypothetical protein
MVGWPATARHVSDCDHMVRPNMIVTSGPVDGWALTVLAGNAGAARATAAAANHRCMGVPPD